MKKKRPPRRKIVRRDKAVWLIDGKPYDVAITVSIDGEPSRAARKSSARKGGGGR